MQQMLISYTALSLTTLKKNNILVDIYKPIVNEERNNNK